jgi:hypothetical protein
MPINGFNRKALAIWPGILREINLNISGNLVSSSILHADVHVIDHVGMMNADPQYTMDYGHWIRVASQYQLWHLQAVLSSERR